MYFKLSDWIMLLIQLLSYELTAQVLPCLETAAWYFFIFSFMDVDSNTLSDTDGPTAEEINIFNVLTLNSLMKIVVAFHPNNKGSLFSLKVLFMI